jgi:hypothetical protein
MRLRRARSRVTCVRDIICPWCLDGPKNGGFRPGQVHLEDDRSVDQLTPEAIAAPGDGTKVLLALFSA